MELFVSLRPSVVVLDSNGLDLLSQFRAASLAAAIIVLTANTQEDARICAFEAADDDYLSVQPSRAVGSHSYLSEAERSGSKLMAPSPRHE